MSKNKTYFNKFTKSVIILGVLLNVTLANADLFLNNDLGKSLNSRYTHLATKLLTIPEGAKIMPKNKQPYKHKSFIQQLHDETIVPAQEKPVENNLRQVSHSQRIEYAICQENTDKLNLVTWRNNPKLNDEVYTISLRVEKLVAWHNHPLWGKAYPNNLYLTREEAEKACDIILGEVSENIIKKMFGVYVQEELNFYEQAERDELKEVYKEHKKTMLKIEQRNNKAI